MIYLAQTDTTAGFLSKDYKELNAVKNRSLSTPCLICMAEFSVLLGFTRVPNKHKNFVRKAKKTSFIYPNLKSFRVIKDHPHENFLKSHTWFFSSSANKHKKAFDEQWARHKADVIIDEELFEDTPSRILRLGRSKIRKIRSCV
ncbi:Sua5 YciO YrdC YwlC family protein [Campylobacter sp. MIT 12-5580]|uniref:Sua5 YciO YrdC YwlC family protein n=1 Tax=Campylobacter sp. MIT 12-5580 TaxID=2040651 RepID=UPI0010F6CA0A|nr:Sua5 YciO YrdC YwlC family protein [Campylobacter sp. MIT 12-5580]TKX29770.1 Sua5 YciO YrdC YwlC family protein [Campylobacter sp. MIT 12-5580]